MEKTGPEKAIIRIWLFVVLLILGLMVASPAMAALKPCSISDTPGKAVQRPGIKGDGNGITEFLTQPPNQVNGIFSDSDCDICRNGSQSVADNFVLGSAQTVNQIIFWGGYYPGNTPLAVDDFTVNIYHDNAGVPGTSVYSQSGVVPTDRTDTGVDLSGVDEYLFTLDLPNPPTLAAGTYWVEIFNNTSSIAYDFFWETGTLDAVNGIQGSVWDFQTPGVNWLINPSTDFAFQVNYAEAAPPAAIPTLSEWGMVIFTLLAAGIAIRLIRRRKTEI